MSEYITRLHGALYDLRTCEASQRPEMLRRYREALAEASKLAGCSEALLQAAVAADGGIGFLNGLLCGLTGFPGFIITIWCQLRGWTKDVQRAVFQPVMLAAIVVTAISLSVTGAVTADTVKLYLLGLPALLAGLWLGFKLYGKLDDVAFRKLILLLLLVSGLALIVAHGWPIIRRSTDGS